MISSRRLSVVAGISLVYDIGVGTILLISPGMMASWFGVAMPAPDIFVKLNAVFLLAVGLGYVQPLRRPDAHRAYMWIFGVGLKGAGATVFLLDHVINGSPASFLLFAASDGTLALVTLFALIV